MPFTFVIKIELYHTVSCWISYDRLHFTQFTERKKIYFKCRCNSFSSGDNISSHLILKVLDQT